MHQWRLQVQWKHGLLCTAIAMADTRLQRKREQDVMSNTQVVHFGSRSHFGPSRVHGRSSSSVLTLLRTPSLRSRPHLACSHVLMRDAKREERSMHAIYKYTAYPEDKNAGMPHGKHFPTLLLDAVKRSANRPIKSSCMIGAPTLSRPHRKDSGIYMWW